MAQIILIIEDDRELSDIMRRFLEHAGYQIRCSHTAEAALLELSAQPADLILLDVGLPDMEGCRLCERIRETYDCPIIYVSCMSDTDTIVKALEQGGDDYMVKPIDFDQLLARIHARLRRHRQAGSVPDDPNQVKDREDGVIRFKQFILDKNHHKVIRMERGELKEVALSPIEYSILVYMANNPDTLLLYSDLYENVWECSSLGDVRTVMVHVSNLRKKIDMHQTGMITTVRGAGYIFSDV